MEKPWLILICCEPDVRPPQDALELPCVQAALSRVNLAVLSASEGLYEASAGGGVLLMGNRVAHPISQVIPCDFRLAFLGVPLLGRASCSFPPSVPAILFRTLYSGGGGVEFN